MNTNGLNKFYANIQYVNLRLNELRTNPPGAILNARQRGPQGGGQDARSSFVPFMQYAG